MPPKNKKPKRPLIAPEPSPAGVETPITFVAVPKGKEEKPAAKGEELGIKTATPKARMRNRQWENEHLLGNQYSVYGVRGDLRKWVDDSAKKMKVRNGEVAEFAIDYSVRLLKSDKLKIVTYLNPRGRRHTLFPVRAEDERKFRREKKVIVTWWPFDQDLKKWIGEAGEANDVSQGELVTFLLERARNDHEQGLLTFRFEKGSSDQTEFKLPK